MIPRILTDLISIDEIPPEPAPQIWPIVAIVAGVVAAAAAVIVILLIRKKKKNKE